MKNLYLQQCYSPIIDFFTMTYGYNACIIYVLLYTQLQLATIMYAVNLLTFVWGIHAVTNLRLSYISSVVYPGGDR